LVKFLLSFWLLLLTSVTYAGEKLTVAFGEVMAPWVMANTDEGIIIEILRGAMGPLGYDIEAVYMPYARRSKAYKSGGIDVVSDMNLNTITEYQLVGYFSDIAYNYENYAFSLAKNQLKLHKISDLEQYSVLSWQDAGIHLGAEYAQMIANNPRYSETYDQSNQVRMLFLERAQVVQMDAQIFDYYQMKFTQTKEVDASQAVDRFALFGASPNGFLFKVEKQRDEFNRQLKDLRQSGEYNKIFFRHTQILPISP
jgi:polar amino acid transport system substrate-binding protein